MTKSVFSDVKCHPLDLPSFIRRKVAKSESDADPEVKGLVDTSNDITASRESSAKGEEELRFTKRALAVHGFIRLRWKVRTYISHNTSLS